jgi:hypothetical protein
VEAAGVEPPILNHVATISYVLLLLARTRARVFGMSVETARLSRSGEALTKSVHADLDRYCTFLGPAAPQTAWMSARAGGPKGVIAGPDRGYTDHRAR